MTIKDIIAIVKDNTVIRVWKKGKLIGTQDDTKTIPEEYHSAKVKSITTGTFFINVNI